MLEQEVMLAGRRLKNPFVYLPMGLGAMTLEQRLAHYEAVARGGVGLMIMEATQVSAEPARRYPVMPGLSAQSMALGLYTDADEAWLAQGAERGQAQGAERGQAQGVVMLVQLAHQGLDEPLTDRLLSDWPAEKMTQIQQAFVQAAQRAQRAGLAGVELHAGHGLLLSQVLAPAVNDRTDRWGGTLEKRASYVLEIVAGIQAACGADFIVGVRFGCNEPTLAASIQTAQLLAQSGVDFLDVSAGLNASVYLGLERPADFPYSRKIYGAWQIRQKVSVPVIAVEGIRTAAQAADILEKQYADLIGLGRPLLADPDWPRKVLAGRTPNPCRGCSRCFWYQDAARCPARRGQA